MARGGRHHGELSQNPKAIRQRAYRNKNRERVRQQAKAWYASNPEKGYPGGWAQRLIYTAASNCRRSGRRISIDAAYLRDIWEKQNGLCYWSGVPLEITRRSPWVVSLDRLDNSRGYEPGNVALASWLMNRARSNMTTEHFADALHTLSMSLGHWHVPKKDVA